MSKVGIQPVIVPEGSTVSVADNRVTAQGPKGSLSFIFPKVLSITVEKDKAKVEIVKQRDTSSALHGLFRTLLANALTGVVTGWEKTLEVHGTGFRAAMEGKQLTLRLGFSHPVTFTPPETVSIGVKGNTIIVSGVDKQKVGEIAASIRRIRTPDSYKGKGIRYAGEIVHLKPGKKAKAAA